MKIVNYFFLVIFILFALLQYNDPDPYIWIPIYLYGAFICWMSIKGRFLKKAYFIGFLVYLTYACYLFFTKDGVLDWMNLYHSENLVQTMKAEKPWIEDTREFGGLIILISVLWINYKTSNKKN